MPETLNIPDDLAACQQLVRELIEANRRLQKIHEELLATCTSVQDSRLKLQQQKEELEQTIKELMHRMYGRRSERHIGSPDQLSLDFGEGEHVAVIPDVTDDETFVVEHEEKKKRRKKKKRAGQFPDHLERRVQRIEPVLPEGVRPEDCELIGVDIVEVLDFERPRLWIRRFEYPKYKIPSQPKLKIQQGPREPTLIPGESFGFGIAAEVLFNKFALHVPLYRQQDPFAQLGWAPNRSTLCQIVINSTDLLRPLAELETERVLAASVINTDDTEVTLLTPGEGKASRKARF